jgi:hypothetical protein
MSSKVDTFCNSKHKSAQSYGLSLSDMVSSSICMHAAADALRESRTSSPSIPFRTPRYACIVARAVAFTASATYSSPFHRPPRALTAFFGGPFFPSMITQKVEGDPHLLLEILHLYFPAFSILYPTAHRLSPSSSRAASTIDLHLQFIRRISPHCFFGVKSKISLNWKRVPVTPV